MPLLCPQIASRVRQDNFHIIRAVDANLVLAEFAQLKPTEVSVAASDIQRKADHIVGETRVIRVRRTVDGRKCSDDIIEGISWSS